MQVIAQSCPPLRVGVNTPSGYLQSGGGTKHRQRNGPADASDSAVARLRYAALQLVPSSGPVALSSTYKVTPKVTFRPPLASETLPAPSTAATEKANLPRVCGAVVQASPDSWSALMGEPSRLKRKQGPPGTVNVGVRTSVMLSVSEGPESPAARPWIKR
jgi:hypothetical protein